MDAVWAVLARHALRDHAQPRLCRGKLREARLAAQARGGAGEDHRAAAKRHQSPRRFSTHQESGEAADAPQLLELRRGHFAEIDALVVAGVERDEVERLARAIEQARDVVLA